MCSKMLPDVGMVQMYSKLANVNDLGFACTGWPPSLHGPALLLVPTFFPPGIYMKVVQRPMALQRH